MTNIQLFNEDNTATMARIKNESVDVILTDPPYLYLKGQKLERPFDENKFFSECKRVLAKDGFIVLFGRGTSFYRCNTILADMGFKFKEEIVWDKSYCTSPLMAISRVHETMSIFTKGKGIINKVKIPYLEMKGHDVSSICQDIKRMRSILKNTKSLDAVLQFLENNRRDDRIEQEAFTKYEATCDKRKKGDRAADVIQSINNGLNEKTIIRTDMKPNLTSKGVSVRRGLVEGDRTVTVVNAISNGLNEKTIIKETRDHYTAIHPTQKPVRLLERLLALVLPKKERDDITVLDPFGGSFSTMEACINMGVNGISCEIDKEYFTDGKERIETRSKAVKQPKLFKEAI